MATWLICLHAATNAAEPGTSRVETSSITIRRWTVTAPNLIQRSFHQPKQGILILNSADPRSNGPWTHQVVDTSNGKVVYQGAGVAGMLSADGRYLVGQFGIRDTSTGVIVDTADFTGSHMYGKWDFLPAPSANLFARFPEPMFHRTPIADLRVYSSTGALIQDLSEKIWASFSSPQDWGSRYFVEFLPDDRLLVFANGEKESRLLLLDPRSGQALWDIPAPDLPTDGYAFVFTASNGSFFLLLNHPYRTSGFRYGLREICAFSSEGRRFWCKKHPDVHLGGLHPSANGAYVAALAKRSNPIPGAVERAAIVNKILLFDSADGTVAWETWEKGVPFFVDDSGEFVLLNDSNPERPVVRKVWSAGGQSEEQVVVSPAEHHQLFRPSFDTKNGLWIWPLEKQAMGIELK